MSLEQWGFGPFFAGQIERMGDPHLVPARITTDSRTLYPLAGVRASWGELSGQLLQKLPPEMRPVVGDWVAVEDHPERAIVHHVLERRTALRRRAAGARGGVQIIAANVDLFFIVTSANLDFNLRRLERYLAAVWDSGARPVLVLNKVDLGGDVPSMVRGMEAVGLGVPVVAVSAAEGAGLEALEAHLAPGLTVALVGSSGVGKSTITNRLAGAAAQEVAGLRRDGRGRHTTTRRALVPLPGGALLIDTPGMREFGMAGDGAGMAATFADVVALAEGCRFRDCRHQGEPGCALTAAVASGTLAPERLSSYQKLQRELAALERRRDPTQAGRSKRRWKNVRKAIRARAKVDPKSKK